MYQLMLTLRTLIDTSDLLATTRFSVRTGSPNAQIPQKQNPTKRMRELDPLIISEDFV
jgi:hypothetical protein